MEYFLIYQKLQYLGSVYFEVFTSLPAAAKGDQRSGWN